MSRTTPVFEVISNAAVAETAPNERDPAQWHQAMEVARHVCARIFRDGGKPSDAVATFGLDRSVAESSDWSRAVDVIAQYLCANPVRRAA